MSWTMEDIREVIWCNMYCRKNLTDKYKKVNAVWRQMTSRQQDVHGCKETHQPEKLS